MTIKCPSTSSAESSARKSKAKSMPKSKKVINSRKNEARPALTKTRANKKLHRVADAIKKHHKQKRCEPVHVFVGNLDKTVSEDAIEEHFCHCGEISSVEIRCSGGLAMTTGRPDPAYVLDYAVSQYAIVTFIDESAARKALELNGSRLEAMEIVVSRSPADLPEVIEKVQQRLREYRARQTFPDPKRARKSVMRALNLEPTIIVEACRDPDPRKKINLFGVSFPMPLF